MKIPRTGFKRNGHIYICDEAIIQQTPHGDYSYQLIDKCPNHPDPEARKIFNTEISGFKTRIAAIHAATKTNKERRPI